MTPRFSLAEIAERLGLEVVGDGSREVVDIRPLDEAGPEHLSFLHNPRYAAQARASRAGALIVGDPSPFEGRDLLVGENPYLAFARALELLVPSSPPDPGVHPSAAVADGVEIEEGVSIGPMVSIGAGARVGARSVIGAGCVIGREVELGSACLLHARVVIEDRCTVGARCILHAGVVIGSDGYGFATVGGVHHKVPQVGVVVIEDDVELGANVCVDRATLGETRIGRGTKVDNLVQIGHNVQIGEGSLLVAQVGIAGSTRLGHHVVMAGQAGSAGHLSIGDGAQVTARAAVFRDVPAGAMVSGNPARPHREFLRAAANVQRLESLRAQVKRLEAEVAKLQRNQGGKT